MKQKELESVHPGRATKAAIALAALGFTAVSGDAGAFASNPGADDRRGVDILLQWSDVALGFYPEYTHFVTHARELALVHVAMHDAINSIRARYTTYAGRVPARRSASPEAAAAAAAHYISVQLHPELEDYLDGVYQDSLAALPDNHRTRKGVRVGEAAAEQLWSLRINDGWDLPTPDYVFPTPGPGVWRQVPPTPPTTPPPYPQWRYVDPWAIESAAQFLAPPPPALTSETFRNDVHEVKALAATGSLVRTQDQTESALWWASQPGMLVANQLGQQLVVNADMNFFDATRVLALINIVFADVTIANIDSKETYQFWRPYTAITVDYGIPGLEIDPTWTPFINTSPNQEYPSAHAQGGGAIAGVFEPFFGTGPLPSPVGYTSPNGVYRTFESIPEIEQDVINARVIGGMHYRNSNLVGASLGRGIAAWALDHVLLPVHGH